ncbi:hypothetical protein HYY27_05375 [bacterium]|nr:hypothetical protein [bacterium]
MKARTIGTIIFCTVMGVTGLRCSADRAPLSAPATKPAAKPTPEAGGHGSRTVHSRQKMFFADRDNRISLDRTSLAAPAGALHKKTMISLQITFTEPRSGVVNRIYDLGPHGLAFQKPVALILSFEGASLAGLDPSTLAIWYYDETLRKWVNMGGVIDAEGKRAIFVGRLPHFSRYAVAGSGFDCPEAGW